MRFTPSLLAPLLVAVAGAPAAQGALWERFAHPADPHAIGNGPMQLVELFDASPPATIQVPTLIVLIEYSDIQHAVAAHTPAFYADLVFGNGGPYSSQRSSVSDILRENTDGRLVLVPAFETSGATNDGVVGWVTAQCPDCESPGVPCDSTYYTGGNLSDRTGEKRRAEALRRADAFVNYTQYDSNGDGELTRDELTVLVIGPDLATVCDWHAPAHGCSRGVSNSCATGCTGSGASVRDTEPQEVGLDCSRFDDCCAQGYPLRASLNIAAVGEGIDASTIAHELAHSRLGLGDLYANGDLITKPESWAYQWTLVQSVSEQRLLFYENDGTPANDLLSGAISLGDGDEVDGYTVGATGSDSSSCAYNDWRDVWFFYAPAADAAVTVNMCFGNCDLLDSTLTLYTQPLPGGSLIELPGGCEDDDPSCSVCTLHPNVTVSLLAGDRLWIRVAGYDGAEGRFRLRLTGGGGTTSYPEPDTWFPYRPERYSLMSGHYTTEYLVHLDPWSKIHLGTVRPQVATHDGWYTLHRTETERTWVTQATQPEALIVYDPLAALVDGDPDIEPEDRYLILENRHLAADGTSPSGVTDSGLAVWAVDETHPFGGYPNDQMRKNLGLRRRGGGLTGDDVALWDAAGGGYDLTPTSSPANSAWLDQTPSRIEVTDIPAAASAMTFFVRLPPIFVDGAVIGNQYGTFDQPYHTLLPALFAIVNQDLDGDGLRDGSRTVSIKTGDYPTGPLLIQTACTLRARDGSVLLR